MYEVIFTDEAKKQLASLDVFLRQKIGSIIERIKIRPHKFARRLYNSKYYRIRVDNYRVILDIQDVKLIIYVIEMEPRNKIYK